MKLTDRYKFLEPVAGGKVSTYLARDSSSGKRVLVHIFKPQPLGTGQQSVLSVLQMFRRLAPNPPGLVLQAGTDEEASRAYIIAEVPAAVALQEWVRLYKLHSGTTEEISPSSEFSTGTGEASPEPANIAPAGSQTTTVPWTSESMESPEELHSTQLSALPIPAPSDSELKREAPEKLPEAGNRGGPFGKSEPYSSRRPIPGAFTKEFLSAFGADLKALQANSQTTNQPNTQSRGAFTSEFWLTGMDKQAASGTQPEGGQEGSSDSSSAVASSSDVPNDFSRSRLAETDQFIGQSGELAKTGTGDFTKFFSGPFKEPQSTHNLMVFPPVASTEPQQRQPGEFTRLFGSVKDAEPVHGRFEATPAAARPEAKPEHGAFTRLFGTMDVASEGASTEVQPQEAAPAVPSKSTAESPLLKPDSAGRTGAWVANSRLNPKEAIGSAKLGAGTVAPVANTLFVQNAKSDATQVFKSPGREEAAITQSENGPSEYTRIISVRSPNATIEPAAPGGPEAAQPSLRVPLPQVPTISAAGQEALPLRQPPVLPSAAAPIPMPQTALPTAAKNVNYWPLVTILTVLLALAVLLVMFFALKH